MDGKLCYHTATEKLHFLYSKWSRKYPRIKLKNKKSPYLLSIVCTSIIPLISCCVVGGHQRSIRVGGLWKGASRQQSVRPLAWPQCVHKCLVKVTWGHLFLLLLLNPNKNTPSCDCKHKKQDTQEPCLKLTCGKSNASLSGASGFMQATPSPFPAASTWEQSNVEEYYWEALNSHNRCFMYGQVKGPACEIW